MLENIISSRNQGWLRNSALNPFADTYINYLIHYGYSDQCVRTYTHSVAHFAYWLKNKKIPLDRVDETTIDQFLFVHLPACNCSRRCRCSLFSVRAALGHLVVWSLRSNITFLLQFTSFRKATVAGDATEGRERES